MINSIINILILGLRLVIEEVTKILPVESCGCRSLEYEMKY